MCEPSTCGHRAPQLRRQRRRLAIHVKWLSIGTTGLAEYSFIKNRSKTFVWFVLMMHSVLCVVSLIFSYDMNVDKGTNNKSVVMNKIIRRETNYNMIVIIDHRY